MGVGAALTADADDEPTTIGRSDAALLSRARPDAPERTPKLAAGVARRIEDDIVAAGWPVGTNFGSEPGLIDRYGVSRAIFREAIRLVEHHEVAYMRRGRSGGLIVLEPKSSSVTTAVAVYLEYVGTSIDAVLRTRLIIESLAASLAAQRITEAGIARLRDIAREDASADHNLVKPHHQRLHLAIAELSGNPMVILFTEVLATLTAMYLNGPGGPFPLTSGAGGDDPPAATGCAAIERAHVQLVEAIIAGNSSLAEQRAAAHLEAIRSCLADQSAATDWSPAAAGAGTGPTGPGPSEGGTSEARPVTAGAAGETPPAPPPDLPSGKLAELVADALRADISRAGWPVDRVFGSEAELLTRYGVSRAVLREAIRLLEHHSVARMRRGPGGGLVVDRPDPSATVEATARYLEYRRATLHDLRAVRDALELGAVEIVTRRIDRRIAQRLENALLVDAATAADRVAPRGHEMHTAIAAETGNQALAVFVQVLTTLWDHHTAGACSRPTPMPVGEIGASVERSHRGIVDAITAGDSGLARFRMLRHLEALDPWWG